MLYIYKLNVLVLKWDNGRFSIDDGRLDRIAIYKKYKLIKDRMKSRDDVRLLSFTEGIIKFRLGPLEDSARGTANITMEKLTDGNVYRFVVKMTEDTMLNFLWYGSIYSSDMHSLEKILRACGLDGYLKDQDEM
jgi:hypothetical protein